MRLVVILTTSRERHKVRKEWHEALPSLYTKTQEYEEGYTVE